MAIEQGLYQLLTAETSVTTLASGGVFWVMAPGKTPVPYLILNRVWTGDLHTMAGFTGVREALFQVDCYSTTYYGARAMATAVRQTLDAYQDNLPDTDSTAVLSSLVEKDWDLSYEEGSQKGFVFRTMLQFRIWYSEEVVTFSEFVQGGNF